MAEIIEVASDKNPSVTYDVDLEANTCTCPHYQNRLKPQVEVDGIARDCKHLERVKRLRAD